MLPVVETDNQAVTSSSNDMPQNVLHTSFELISENDHGSNVSIDSSSNCSSTIASHSQEADDASGSQLLESEYMSTYHSQQSSVTRLRKQMIMIAQDEDILVHCNIATEEDDAACCQFDDSDNSLMKSTRCSSVCVAVPKNQQQLDVSQSDVMTTSGQYMAFNSAEGSVFSMVVLTAG